MHRALFVLLVVSGSVLAGCSAQAPEGCGELVWGEGGTELSVDLTTLESCDQPMRTLELRNVGGCAVEFDPPEHVSGDAVTFGPDARQGAFFRVDVGASRVDPGRSVTVTVTRDVWTDPEGKKTSVRLRGKHGESVSLDLEALPTVSAWDGVPDTLDFGAVMVGDAWAGEWELRNPAPVSVTYHLEAPTNSAEGSPFSFGGGTQAGEVVLEPGASHTVALRFGPEEVGNFVAFQRVRIPQCEGERTVKLQGEGVSSVLSWVPAQVDCGYISPGIEVTRQVTFTNAGPRQVELINVGPKNRDEFFVVEAMGAATTSLSVPQASKVDGVWQPGTATLTVGCKPLILGIRNTNLTFDTNLPRQPNGSILVKAIGGGPDIDVSPSPVLSFGKVAYFQNATPPVFSRRKLTVVNEGTPPPAPDLKANLRLGQMDPNTGDVNSTYFEVRPLNGDTQAGEFVVTLPANYDSAKGLEARAGSSRVDLDVIFTPTSVGLKQAELTLYSNDPDEPAVKILVSADAVVLPPCNYTVTASQLAFGRLSPPDVRELAFNILNDGTSPGDLCLLSDLHLTPGSHHSFTIDGQPFMESVELQPGETRQVRVRASSMTATYPPTNVTGMVEFNLSSPTKPVFQVNLLAEFGESCLTVAPHTLDFGVARTGCNGTTQQLRIYNRCSGAVLLNGLTAPSADFTVSGPQIGGAGIALTAGDPPLVFDVTYTPSGAGMHSGMVALAVTQSGNAVTYTVPLFGTANATGTARDAFGMGARKLDLLMVLQDSLSSWQSGLSAAMPSFVQYAQQLEIDYRVAVTTMDMGGGAAQGRFVTGTGHPNKVVSPMSVNPALQLSNKVQVGTFGSATEQCFAPAAAALTAPLVHVENAGFLRPDAPLAIVCVGMEKDQSPEANGWYLDVLRNLKAHAHPSLFTFSSVSGFSPGCQIDDGRLAAAADATGGIKRDLCTPNWPQTLKDLADLEARSREVLTLRAQPDLQQGPIAMTIDGVNVPESTAWSYDAAKNQVVFVPAFAPQPGAAVTVEYPVTCHP